MRPKYSLGQNFLKNPGIVDKIIHFSEVSREDTILEIGPGTGALTARLLEDASEVIAVEKDDVLAAKLKEQFESFSTFKLLHGDILETDLQSILRDNTKVVANLPYNIATNVILRLADIPEKLRAAVVMVQKEVALRICSHAGQKDYSALSAILSSVFDCVPGFIVGPKNFYPEPKVDSMVIKLIPKEAPLPKDDRDGYKKVVFCAFGQRRKMLKNSLMNLPGVTKDLLAEIGNSSGISLERRPQELSWEEFYRLSRTCRRLAIS